MRSSNTGLFGTLLSFVILGPVAIFLGLVWLWDFTKGFVTAAMDRFLAEEFDDESE
jgi:hypothetical protein